MHDKLTLIRSLTSELCPACGGKKKARQTLCLKDYRALPKELRNRLWYEVGDGYEEAVQDALTFLEVESPAFPPAPVAAFQDPPPRPQPQPLTFSKTRSFTAPPSALRASP